MTPFFRDRSNADIQSQLRANRPAPRPDVLDGVVSRIVGSRETTSRRPAKRHWVAIAGVLGLVGALASFGALAPAQKSAATAASATADAAVQIVSQPTSSSADEAGKGATAPATGSSGGSTASEDGQAASSSSGSSATTPAPGSVDAQTSSDNRPPSGRFLATIGTYAANQWICHYKGGPNPNAPGQWDAVQLTSLAVYNAHFPAHTTDTGPFASEPTGAFCVANQEP